MPNGFATYMRLNTVMQSETNAKVARPGFVNASPKQMAQLTDFQHAPFNGTKSDEVGKKRKH